MGCEPFYTVAYSHPLILVIAADGIAAAGVQDWLLPTLLCFFFDTESQVSGGGGGPQTHYIAENGLELLNFLSQPPK